MSGFGWVDDVLRSGYWQRGRRVEVQNLAAWTAGSSPDFVSIYWIRRRANSLPAAAKTFGFPICHPSAFQFLCFYQFSPSEWQCSQSFGFPPFGFPVTHFKQPRLRVGFQDTESEGPISRHQMQGPQQQEIKPFRPNGDLNPSHLLVSPQSYHYTTRTCLLYLMNDFDVLKVKPLSSWNESNPK